MTCAIIEDEPLAAELLQAYLERMGGIDLVGTFHDALSGLDYIRKNKVDLLFLDIQMPHINGMQLLRSLDEPPMVIFTTAYSEYAVEGFELDAVDYLLKPFSYDRFEKAVTRATEYRRFLNKEAQAVPYLFVKSEYQLIRINHDDIRYIEALDDYIKICTINARPVLTLMTLKSILEKLPDDKFTRVHRSFIVSVPKIESVRNRRIKIGDNEIPIGSSYSDNFNTTLSKFI